MKIISFRFDDGLWLGIQKAIKIMSPHKASFYIVRDWLADYNRAILDEFNIGKYHGSIAEWRLLSQAGHDIQAHSCTHRNFSLLEKKERIQELKYSRELISEIHDGDCIMCYPYNVQTKDNLASLGYSGGGFLTLPSDKPIQYNTLGKLDSYNLKSWAIREHHLDNILDQLEKTPDNSWTILALHSLDGEGFEPWSSNSFKKLVKQISKMNCEILTVAETLRIWNQKKA